jgi:hypothetical protein
VVSIRKEKSRLSFSLLENLENPDNPPPPAICLTTIESATHPVTSAPQHLAFVPGSFGVNKGLVGGSSIPH